MYLPEAYKIKDRERTVKFINQNNFGDLVTNCNGILCSNKVPFLFDSDKNELFGHLGKGNEQLIDLHNSEEALVIFSGAHSYISPRWYVSKNSVPTWNFQTVQCRGRPSLVSKQELLVILEKLTKYHESSSGNPWSMAELDPEKKEKMVDMITGFKIEITDIKFKEKMSQIREIDDRRNIIKELAIQGTTMSKEVAKIMMNGIES